MRNRIIRALAARRPLLTIVLVLLASLEALGCTVMIVAASATKDGRPLLFKNRDSSSAYMVEMKVEDGNGFKHMAQYALSDGNWMGPWGGFNEEGFCIVNTLSYNFSGAELASMNSQIIDMALRQCKTTADFEQLIDGLSKPIDVKANYGVIDAQQHAAFYEVGPNGYIKYDVDDPQIAPNGVLVRTNYSLTGDTDRKVGEERWKAAEQFAADAIASDQLDWRYILQTLPRYLMHCNGTNLYATAPATWNEEAKTDIDGYIPRHSSTNAMLMQGVKDSESPLLTTCWAMVGPPIATAAVPLFLTPNSILPQKVMANGGNAWLCEKGQQLKAVIFPYPENTTKNIDLSKLYNREETGIMQRILKIEEEIIERGNNLIADTRQRGTVSEESLTDYYVWLDNYLEQEYKSHFNAMTTGVSVLTEKNVLPNEWWGIDGQKLRTSSCYRGVVIGRQGKFMRH